MKLNTIKKSLSLTIIASLVLTSVSMSGFAAKKEVTVSAAASLSGALGEIERKYEASHKDTDIKINYGASGALQQQIENGAKVDIFISAASKQMDTLQSKGFMDNSTVRNLLGNKLILITQKSNTSVKNSSSLTGISKIAVGEPKSVPVGMYTSEYLKNIGLYDALSNKFIYGKDVKQVLTWVSTGNAPAGFVYLSDAKSDKKVKVVETAKSGKHQPIVYPAGMLKNAPNKATASKFFKYMNGKTCKKVFLKYGFSYIKK